MTDPLASLLVPLPASAETVVGDGPVDLGHGVHVRWVDERCAGVGTHLQADLDRVLGPPDDERAVPLALSLHDLGPDRSPEGYRLHVGDGVSLLAAATEAGLARGAATYRQLVDRPTRTAVPMVIDDAPRFAWRGLLVDCVRHFMPLDALRRTVDAMALAKLNVLHLHLTDDQAWRVASRAHPQLTERASPGGHYELDDLAALVAHAADRGVRVVPELDVPGHTSALLVAFPELALGAPPASVPTSYVVPGVSVDPSSEAVFEVLDTIVGEWAEVFPDECFHIGGDEVPVLGEERQAAFTARMVAIVRGHGRTPIVWDEALHPGLDRDVIVQAWRSPALLHEAVRAGHRAILSSGWYLDLGVPLRHLHAVDPLDPPERLQASVLAPWRDADLAGVVGPMAAATVEQAGSLDGASPLTAEERSRVLGGEAAMWCERVTPALLDTYLWPLAAAVADRLWSPAGSLAALDHGLVENRFDLLPAFGVWTDVDPKRGPRVILGALADLAGDHGLDPRRAEVALAALADWCEPVRWYARAVVGWPDANGRSDDAPPPGTGQPLDRFVDALGPEADGPRAWRRRTARPAPGDAYALVAAWRAPAAVLGPLSDGPSILAEPARLADRLAAAADVLAALLDAAAGGSTSAGVPAAEAEAEAEAVAALGPLRAPIGEATIAVTSVFRALGAQGRA